MKGLCFFAAVSLIVFLPVRAFAYLDPGTGSYVLQIVIAAAVSGAFVLKTFWNTLKKKISQIFAKDK